ncbi:histidinol-phosphate transaminase [Fodinicurvata sp. EGI_FJ10296]|uniref:histidinol-phosphate transaminase n=1 Tax=Fodinicurvata sp. EGI_FJ10296 TaxID=3231908 RepID=UPI0034538D3E
MTTGPMNTGPTPRPGILEITPYVGGESSANAKRLIRLASNEGALGTSPAAKAAYEVAAAELHRYPDGGSTALRETIAEIHGLNVDQIVCGAGSDELIALLTRAYAGPGDEVLYSRHGFLMYPLSAMACGATPVAAPEPGLKADVDLVLASVTDRTRIVFIANPNNPTGSYLSTAEIERLHAGLPAHVLLVIDAAYAEYVDAPDYSAGAALAESTTNVVMTRTFSKIYGLSALRLGWAYCPPGIADILNRIRGPFNVSLPAQKAGEAAIRDTDFIERSRAHNEQWRDWTAAALSDLGLKVHPSVCNFLLVDFAGIPGISAEDARIALKDQGILVRQMGAYGLPTCLRIGIGLEDEMRPVIEAMRTVMAGAGQAATG